MSHDNRIFIAGKEAGQIEGEELVIIKTDKSHFSYKFNGYGISPSTLYEAEERGATRIKLIGYDGETFRCTIKEYRAAGIRADLGAGLQLFLSLKSLRYYTNHKQAYRNEPLQISMFG